MPVSHPPPDRFVVEPRKIASYLLNIAHPDGRSKANFFIGWGFDPANPQGLTAALLDHPRTATLTETADTAWGPRFVYEGALAAPRGATPSIRSVWEVRPGENMARLITAYRARGGPTP